MKEKVEQIKNQLLEDIKSVKTTQDIVDIKAKYIGKSGLITDLMKNMKDYSPEERKEIGERAKKFILTKKNPVVMTKKIVKMWEEL